VDRATGSARVLVQGGAFATGGYLTLNLEMLLFGVGVTDCDVSTFINNPSWFVGAAQTNPAGVVEPGIVRIALQVDRPGSGGNTPGFLGREETVQTTMLRPQN
jgi:hypothetical protein